MHFYYSYYFLSFYQIYSISWTVTMIFYRPHADIWVLIWVIIQRPNKILWKTLKNDLVCLSFRYEVLSSSSNVNSYHYRANHRLSLIFHVFNCFSALYHPFNAQQFTFKGRLKLFCALFCYIMLRESTVCESSPCIDERWLLIVSPRQNGGGWKKWLNSDLIY